MLRLATACSISGAARELAGRERLVALAEPVNGQQRDEHRQQHRRRGHLMHVVRDQLVRDAHAQQHETGCSPACASCTAVRRATSRLLPTSAEMPAITVRFRADQQTQHEQHAAKIGGHSQIELHADGHEKQPEQHLAEQADVRFHWWRYTVSAISTPATKAPSASDKPASAVIPEQPDHHQENVQHEQLAGFEAHDQAQPAAHVELSDHQQQASTSAACSIALASDTKSASEGAASAGMMSSKEHRQILKEQHAHRLTTGQRIELEALGKQARDDGGRRHVATAAPVATPTCGDYRNNRR